MRVRAAAIGMALATLAGCGSTAASTTTPTTTSVAAPTTPVAATTPAAPLPSCGAVPVTHGPSQGLIGATTSGPATARAGSTINGAVHLASLDGKTHTFDSGAAPVLILQDGRLVGEYEGAFAAYGTEVKVKPGVPNSMPFSVLLSGCPQSPVYQSAPDLGRKPLPPGSYQLVVDLPDVTSRPFGDLVSSPMPLQVTSDPAALPSCGDVPVSTGPSAQTIGAQLTAPAAAASGSSVPVQVLLRSYRVSRSRSRAACRSRCWWYGTAPSWAGRTGRSPGWASRSRCLRPGPSR